MANYGFRPIFDEKALGRVWDWKMSPSDLCFNIPLAAEE